MTEEQNILDYIPYLFDRPCKTLLTGRDNVEFDIPSEMLVSKFNLFFVESRYK